MLMGLFAVADTLVLALLGEQWMVCVPFLRIMCISNCFWPIHITNLQAINAVGRSDIFLKLELVKKGLSLVALLVGIQFNVFIMVCIKAFQDFLCTFVNAAPNQKALSATGLNHCICRKRTDSCHKHCIFHHPTVSGRFILPIFRLLTRWEEVIFF